MTPTPTPTPSRHGGGASPLAAVGAFVRTSLCGLLRFYALTLLFFLAAKVAFMLYNHEAVPVLTAADVRQVLWHGLSLDLSTSLYLLMPPYLLAVASLWWRGRGLRAAFRAYAWLVALALSLAVVADASLYPFWKFKLDASCLDYLSTPTEAMASVPASFVAWRLAAVAVAAAVLGRRLSRCRVWAAPAAVARRVWCTLLSLLLLPIIIIGVRGGVDESTTNIGQVYFSQQQFLNHSAVNPVFSFLASFEKSSAQVVVYDLMDEAECRRLTAPLFTTASVGTDSLLTTRTPNIVVILLESMGGQFTEIGGRTDVTPRFNALCREGVYFTQCYANSWRTDRGTLCTWSGYPSFPTMSVMKMPGKTRLLPNLARTLKESRGYRTHYLYGGDINFTNMRSYLVGGGFEQLTWKRDYPADQQRSAQWGVRDDLTFRTLLQLLTDAPADAPLLVGYSTLSSHEPWDVPVSVFADPVLNAFHYLDQCVGRFIDQLRQTDAWQRTLVIMLPDHGINHQGLDQTTPLKNHIPMLWLGGAVRQPRRVGTICNQTDLPATLLAQLGLDHREFAFSRDVLSRTYTHPLAYHTYRNGYALLDSTGFVVYDLDAGRVAAADGTATDSLTRLGKALLQLTSHHLDSLR